MTGAASLRASLFAVAVCAGLTVSGSAPPAAAADAQATLSAFLQTVSVRHGVAHGSLVVLPIVLDVAAPARAAGALSDSEPAASWRSVAGSENVELTAVAAPAGRQRLVPAGTLLVGGDRERVLERPVPLRGDETAVAACAICDDRKKPAVPGEALRPGPIAPLEQRKLASDARARDVLPFVQQIQRAIAGILPGTETVAEVLAAPAVADGVRDRWVELSRIPKACGALTVGHVAFFGFRPMEVVLYARPADYQALGPAHLRSTAASHVFWAEAAGIAAAATDADVKRLVPEGTAVLAGLARMAARPVRPRAGERCRWQMVAGRADSGGAAPGDRRDPFTCRFALDDDGSFACLEAIEAGAEPVYPPPYREPGGTPAGEPPGGKGGGLSPESLERMLKRILENRERRRAEAAKNGGK